jgi:uncharacterized delta-60 repeat protein
VTQGAYTNQITLPVSVQPPAPGSLDPSFGTRGIVSANLTAGSIDCVNAAALAAGDAVVVGGSTKASGGVQMAFVARYTAAGVLDTTFNTTGFATFTWTPTTPGGDTVNGVSVLSDGSVVAFGSTGGTFADFGVAKFTSAGAPDSTFGDGTGPGLATTGGRLSFARGTAMAIQSNGMILGAGSANSGGEIMVVERWLANGSMLDGTFTSTLSFGATIGGNYIYGLGVQSNGQIVLGGYGGDFPTTGTAYLGRLNTNGGTDTTFGTNGVLAMPDAPIDVAYATILQGSNILVAGGFGATGEKFMAGRATSGGVLDSTFGTNGFSAAALSTGSFDYSQADAVALQVDGKVLLGGFASVSSKQNVGVARMSANGALDTTFQGSAAVGTGSVIFPVTTTGADNATAILLQSTGRIIVAGTGNFNGNSIYAPTSGQPFLAALLP